MQYTVICANPESGQIMADVVEANNSMHAFAVAAKLRQDQNVEFVVALKGTFQEDSPEDVISYPGEGLVDPETILGQSEIFS